MVKKNKFDAGRELDASFNDFIAGLGNYNERELSDLLDHEHKNKCRRHYIERIHARFAKVRTAREREELLNVNDNDNDSGV